MTKLTKIIKEINTITSECDGDGNGACVCNQYELYDLLKDYPILLNLIVDYLTRVED